MKVQLLSKHTDVEKPGCYILGDMYSIFSPNILQVLPNATLWISGLYRQTENAAVLHELTAQVFHAVYLVLHLLKLGNKIVCRSIKSTALPTSLKSALRASQCTWFHSYYSLTTQVAIGLRYGINLTHGHLGWVVYQMRRTVNFKIFITFVHPTKFQLLTWLRQWLKSCFIFKMKGW